LLASEDAVETKPKSGLSDAAGRNAFVVDDVDAVDAAPADASGFCGARAELALGAIAVGAFGGGAASPQETRSKMHNAMDCRVMRRG
jgi:hypothetical protein